MSFAYCYLHQALDKNSHVGSSLRLLQWENQKQKKSLGLENEKNRPKEERNGSILSSKEKNLAQSNKGSWFGQTPSTCSASAEDLALSKTLEASSLKSKVNVSAGCEQDSLLESGGGSNEEKECYTNDPKHWSIVDRVESLAAFFFAFNAFGAGVAFAITFGIFAHFCGRLEMSCTKREKKRVAMRCFSQEIVIYCHRH